MRLYAIIAKNHSHGFLGGYLSMKRNLRAQMVGFHHPCLFFNEYQTYEYYEFLHEADEFGAAAGTYPDERQELLANSAHRYQLLVDWTTAKLKLNVSFLNKGKIWFNFYSDIATHFGLGTQAYTTETRRPHVGISEITLQDMYMLQLILLHEMQHAIDFANYAGLHMSLSERELRARISICEGLFAIKDSHEELYLNAMQDVCYWYILHFLTAGVDDQKKQDYFDLLNDDTRYTLSVDGNGVLFTPMVIRSLAKELQREKISLSSMQRYAIDASGKKLKLKLISLLDLDSTAKEPDSLEAMMMEDDGLAPGTVTLKDLSKEELGSMSVDYSREVFTTRNKLSDWQSYDKAYAKLKEQAIAAIERDKPSFEEVKLRLEKGDGHSLDRELFPQMKDYVEQALPPQAQKQEPETLDNLSIPDAMLETDQASLDEMTPEAVPVLLEPLQGGRQRHNIETEELTLPDRMSDLSDFVKQKGGR